MSPNMKLSVLAFVGAAAAIPQYGHGHGHKHHTPSAGSHAYPTGGWGGYNATTPSAVAAGTGKSSSPAGISTPSVEETTITESDYTITSTTTRTVYLTVDTNTASPTEVAVKDVTSEAPACGQTVYVTATQKVTVTVPAGGASSSTPEASSAAPAAPSSAPGYEASVPVKPSSSKAPVASASSAPGYEVPSSFVMASSVVNKGQEKPTSAAAVSSPAPVEEAVSSTAAPASSVEASSAPASTPSTSPSTGYSGGKRGLAYRWDGAADCKSFEGKNFGFVWNWEADTKGDVGTFAPNFIPTLRTLENAGDWSEKVEAAISAGSKVVFGLNEPDIASQANLGVDALCDAWKTYMNPIVEKHSGVTVVGPSVSSSENEGQGLSYLSSFVEKCSAAKFHDINIHWYGPATAGFDAFKAHFEEAVSKFPGKKVWVTEFGLTGSTADESADFLKSAQAYLDSNDNCAGYSYFAVGSFDASANLLGTASALTKTGEVYVN
ncbi:hypothetical protein N0V90_002479 [Kalmusia sp. IMI 367209]|nr:hypothetical protein N0V90_002479 [Kalmusia sp. IMI 367209]